MEFLALAVMLVMGMVLGWMLGLESGKKSVQESERAYWFQMVQGLEKDLRWEKAKALARQLGQEK